MREVTGFGTSPRLQAGGRTVNAWSWVVGSAEAGVGSVETCDAGWLIGLNRANSRIVVAGVASVFGAVATTFAFAVIVKIFSFSAP